MSNSGLGDRKLQERYLNNWIEVVTHFHSTDTELTQLNGERSKSSISHLVVTGKLRYPIFYKRCFIIIILYCILKHILEIYVKITYF